eukprot:TRINITY_DN385_c1_g2_i1.p1 TRINITY_DN385_c1_g2~~TRINITY_DN385_c1_g2_i1.p1  ORF type:complete len:839 (-),score=212.52 TRINITY_DN385_c1_g2_i1:241-2757(-)
MVRTWIDDGRDTGRQVGDQVTGAGADAETVAGEAGRQDQPGHLRCLANAGYAIGRAVHIAGPGMRHPGITQLGQQFDGTAVGGADGDRIGLGIEHTHALHRCRRIQAPARQGLVAAAQRLQAARRQAAPALGEHGQELWREAQELPGRIDPRATADGQRIGAVAAPRGRHPRGEQRTRQRLLHGRHAHDGLPHRGLREADAQLPAERGSPGATGQDGGTGLDDAGLGDDRRKTSAFHLDAACGALLDDAAAQLDHRARHGRSGLARIGGAVGGREHAALPTASGGVAAFAGLFAVEHVGGDAGSLGELAPVGPARELLVVIGEIEQAAASETGILAGLGAELFPQVDALGGHGQFAGVAVLLAAPAPVAAGLLGADPALLDQHHRHATPRQVIGGEDADDAAADHDYVGRGGRCGGGLYPVQRRRHAYFSSLAATTVCTTQNLATRARLSQPMEAPCATKMASPFPAVSTLPSGWAKSTSPSRMCMNSLTGWARTMRWQGVASQVPARYLMLSSLMTLSLRHCGTGPSSSLGSITVAEGLKLASARSGNTPACVACAHSAAQNISSACDDAVTRRAVPTPMTMPLPGVSTSGAAPSVSTVSSPCTTVRVSTCGKRAISSLPSKRRRPALMAPLPCQAISRQGAKGSSAPRPPGRNAVETGAPEARYNTSTAVMSSPGEGPATGSSTRSVAAQGDRLRTAAGASSNRQIVKRSRPRPAAVAPGPAAARYRSGDKGSRRHAPCCGGAAAPRCRRHPRARHSAAGRRRCRARHRPARSAAACADRHRRPAPASPAAWPAPRTATGANTGDKAAPSSPRAGGWRPCGRRRAPRCRRRWRVRC